MFLKARLILSLVLFLAYESATAAEAMSVFIFAGQSNACGAGSRLTELPNYTTESPILFSYKMMGSIRTYDPLAESTWIKSTSLERLHPVRNGRFGSEISLAERLHASGKYGKVLVVKVCAGSSNLSDDWLGTNRLLRDHLFPQVQEALALARARGFSPVVRGFFWIQGESDVHTDLSPFYGSFLNRLMRNLRLVYGSSLPVVAVRIRGNKNLALDDAELASIRSQQHLVGACEDLAQTVPIDDILIPSEDFVPFRDEIHWTYAAHRKIGRRMADAYERLEGIRLENRADDLEKARCTSIFESKWANSVSLWRSAIAEAPPEDRSSVRQEKLFECQVMLQSYKWYVPSLVGTTCAEPLD
jgi:hypothetical protein